MKLLVFSPYYPPHVGGLQSHAEQFNNHFSQKGTNVTVFTSHLPLSSPSSETTSTIKIIRFPAWEIIPNYPLPKFWQSAFWLMWRQIKEQKFDVVVSRTRFFFTSLLAFAYARGSHTPWLHIEHGSDFVSLSSPLTNLLARFYDYTFGRLVLHLADEVVANSYASAAFVKYLTGRNVHVIYRGIETDEILNTPPNLDIKKAHHNKTIITFVGRLIDGKSVGDLLRAIKIITSYQLLVTSYPFHCLIIGDGPQSQPLAKLARRLDISKHITFLGQQNFNQAMSILKTSDIFVNPSHTEGLPTSVIEAALCKAAIIATAVGGTSEIITNNVSAYLIPPHQPNVLADKLALLLLNPDKRTNLSNHAYQEVLNKFSWTQSLAAYNKVFKQLL